MIRAVVAAVVVLIFSATAAFALQDTASVRLAIDTDTAGNAANVVGSLDVCRSASVGDTFDIDVVIQGVPDHVPGPSDAPAGTASIVAFQYNIHFDPAVLQITAADDQFMVASSPDFESIQANFVLHGDPNPFPATTGDTSIAYSSLAPTYPSGDGVLTRLTVKAIAAGVSDLTLDDEPDQAEAPIIADAASQPYDVSQLQNAVIAVGQSCDQVAAPSPTNPAEPTPEPTPSASPVASTPAGDTTISVDAVTTGNTATSVGQIDDCASADNGETFTVDVVIQGVQKLLAWDGPISYNNNVLKVVDRDAKLFLAANAGSQVFDASNQTPNTTGVYRAAAVDQADPGSAEPDSGDGVLIRLTMEAVGEGTSTISLAPIDANEDGTPDTGLILKDVDANFIGGNPFSGPINDAEIRVGDQCPAGAHVVKSEASSSGGGNLATDEGGSSNTWILVVAGVAIAFVAVGGGAVWLLRRRRREDHGTPV